jgi:hypothetical protein
MDCLRFVKALGSLSRLMRVALATMVALLILYTMDEQFNDARYARAGMVMLSKIVGSFG